MCDNHLNFTNGIVCIRSKTEKEDEKMGLTKKGDGVKKAINETIKSTFMRYDKNHLTYIERGKPTPMSLFIYFFSKHLT